MSNLDNNQSGAIEAITENIDSDLYAIRTAKLSMMEELDNLRAISEAQAGAQLLKIMQEIKDIFAGLV